MVLFVLVQYRRRWWLGGWRLRGPRAYKWPLVDTASSIINENQNNHPARFSPHYCHSFFQRCFHRNRFPLTKKTSTHDTSSARWQSGRDQRSTPCMWPAFCLSLSFCLVDQRSTKSLACQNPNNLVPSEPSTSKSRKRKCASPQKNFSISCQTPLMRLGSEDTLLVMDSGFMFDHWQEKWSWGTLKVSI